MRLILMVAVVALSGCGDPRAPFVGVYEGSGTRTFTFSDGSTRVETFDANFAVTAPAKSSRLQFDVACMFTAEPLDAETLQIDAVTCPTVRGTSLGGATADFTEDFDVGTARLANKTLTITQPAVQIGSNYSDGTPTQRFPFVLKLSVVRQ